MERPYKIELHVTYDDMHTADFSFRYPTEEVWNDQYEALCDTCVNGFVRKTLLGWRITRSIVTEEVSK